MGDCQLLNICNRLYFNERDKERGLCRRAVFPAKYSWLDDDMKYIRPFQLLRRSDVALVGGKNASLGEG